MNVYQTEIGRSGGYWSVLKIHTQFFKDPVAALVWSELLEQRHMQGYPEFINFSYQSIATRLCVSAHAVTNIMQKFLAMNIITPKRFGIPSRIFYKVNFEELEEQVKSFVSTDRENKVCTDQGSASVYKETNTKETREEGKDSSSLGDADASGTGVKPVLVRRAKKAPSLFPSQACEDVFNHWCNVGCILQSHKIDPSSKTFQTSIAEITKALRKHSPQVIIQAITDYNTILSDPNTTIVINGVGHKVPLYEFFKFTNHTETRMLSSRNPLTIVSWFDECLKGLVHLNKEFGKYDRDDNPKVTEGLIITYQNKVSAANLSVSDVNCFIKAAKFVVEYQSKNKDKINWNSCLMEKTHPVMFAHRLIDAVLEDAQDVNMIAPTWLCSPRTINSRFPKYLKRHGLITADDFKSNPKSTAKVPQGIKKGYSPKYQDGEIE